MELNSKDHTHNIKSNLQVTPALESFDQELNDAVVKLQKLSVGEENLENEPEIWASLGFILRRNRNELGDVLAEKTVHAVWSRFDVRATSSALVHRRRAVLESLSKHGNTTSYLLQIAAQAPLHSQRTLRVLSLIFPKLTAQEILQAFPNIIHDSINTFYYDEESVVSPLVSRVLLSFVTRIKAEEDEKDEKEKQRPKQKDQEENGIATSTDKSKASAAAYDSLMIKSLSEALMAPNARDNLTRYFLTPFLKARSDLVSPLVHECKLKLESGSFSVLNAYSAIFAVAQASPNSVAVNLDDHIIMSALQSFSLDVRSCAFLYITSAHVHNADTHARRLAMYLHFYQLNMGEASPTGRNVHITGLWPILRRLGNSQASFELGMKSFFPSFIDIILSACSPQRPYRFRVTSIRLLDALLEFTTKQCNANIEPFLDLVRSDKRIPRALLLALLDTYDDVQHIASQLLSSYSHILLLTQDHRQWLLDYGISLIKAQRESDANGGTLIFDLIWKVWIVNNQECINLNALFPSTIQPSHKITNEKPKLDFINQLVEFAEYLTNQASRDLVNAAVEQPIHGTLHTLSRIIGNLDLKKLDKDSLDEYKSIFHKLLDIIERVWISVRPVLCNVAPEGSINVKSDQDHEETRAFLLTHQDEQDDAEDVLLQQGDSESKHKVVMSACWRAIRAAGELLEKAFSVSASGDVDVLKHIWSIDNISFIGTTYSSWLLNIRHRGAFSAIYPSYTRLCFSLAKLNDNWPEVSSLPKQWLEAHVAHILSGKASTTRRSAGLPYCILAVLGGTLRQFPNLCQKVGFQLLDAASKAEEKTHKPQEDVGEEVISTIHIMNTLKTLYSDSKVGDALTPCIENCVALTIRNFRSPHWGIRNVSTLLYAMLIQRVVGHNRRSAAAAAPLSAPVTLILNKQRQPHPSRCIGALEFFARFPALHETLLNELVSTTEESKNNPEFHTMDSFNSLFSILLFLSFLQVPSSEQVSSRPYYEHFLEPIESSISNRVWKVREVAAEAYASFTFPDYIVKRCQLQVQLLSDCKNYNEFHGRLLVILMLVRRCKSPFKALYPVMKKLEKKASWFLHNDLPASIKMTFIEIFGELLYAKDEYTDNCRLSAFKDSFPILSQIISDEANSWKYKYSSLNAEQLRISGDVISYLVEIAKLCILLDSDKFIKQFLQVRIPDFQLQVIQFIYKLGFTAEYQHFAPSPLSLSDQTQDVLIRLVIPQPNDPKPVNEVIQEAILNVATSDSTLAQSIVKKLNFKDTFDTFKNTKTEPLREAFLSLISAVVSTDEERITILKYIDTASFMESSETSRMISCRALSLLTSWIGENYVKESDVNSELLKHVMLLIIRLLQDDDEDIRVEAEKLAMVFPLSEVKGARSSLPRHYLKSLEIIWNILLKFYSKDEIMTLFMIKPIEESFSILKAPDTRLFALEKANLFDDNLANLENVQKAFMENLVNDKDINFANSLSTFCNILESLNKLDTSSAMYKTMPTFFYLSSYVVAAYDSMSVTSTEAASKLKNYSSLIDKLRSIITWKR